MGWNNEVYTGTVSIAVLAGCLLMVERVASAETLVLLLQDMRWAAVSTLQNDLLPC